MLHVMVFLICTPSVTRGHTHKIYKPSSICPVRARYFANRVINARNSLPSTVDFSSSDSSNSH